MALIAIKAANRIPESMELNERQAALVMRELIGAEADDIVDSARSNWPRDSGDSADALQDGTEVTSDADFVVFIEDLIWYAGFVPFTPNVTAWNALVVGPAEDEGLVEVLADGVVVALFRPGN